MKSTLVRSGLVVALIVFLAGCGKNEVPGTVASGTATASNPRSAFSLIVDAGLPTVTVSGRPVVNFAVRDSIGNHVPGLTLSGNAACGYNSNVKFMIAKYDGSNWQNLVASGVPDSLTTANLQESSAGGYYTYTFGSNVAAVNDGATIHRLGMRLCFVDPPSGKTVKVNPYLDFTVSASGVAMPVTDSEGKLTDARKVVDKASCNECHQTLASRHDDALVDPNICVICHNAGLVDFPSGNSVDLKLMIHKFHMGRKLSQDYTLNGFVARLNSGGTITGIDYPQEQRNCVKCHDGSATAAHPTPDGNNWKTKPSKNACFACHDDYKVAGSKWQLAHAGVPYVYPTFSVTNPDSNADTLCANCHGDTPPKINTAAMHAVPEWTLAANYQYNIHSVTSNPDRTVSVEFSVSNPLDGSLYDIKSPTFQYTTVDGAGTTTRNFVFGNLTMLFGWGSGDYSNAGAVAAGTWATSCTTVVPTGSPTCNASTGLPNNDTSNAGNLVTRGQPVTVSAFDAVPVPGTNKHFTLTSTVVPTTASGTAVVALQGSVSLQKDANTSFVVPVKSVVSYFALGGTGDAVPRRTVVSADKCNVCHGKNINMNNHVPSHNGNQTKTEVCVICHNGNNVLNGTTVVGGVVTVQPNSAHFKRLIHMRHKGMGANFPVMPRTERTAPTAAGTYIGYTGVRNCDVCHVNGSYKADLGTMGSSTLLDVDLTTNSTNAKITDTDPSNNPVISPKAAVCSSCHDDATVKNHMINVGGAVFGTKTQGDVSAGNVNELCYNCHAPGAFVGVDIMHGLK